MSILLPIARRDLIAQRLADGLPVMAGILATEFAVSEDAIRRDLRALAAEGKCRRVYGGALPLVPGATPISTRIKEGKDRKALLAQAGVGLIKRGDFVFLDSGSTNLAMVEFLPEDLTIATNSIDIASAAMRRQDIHVILVGGSVNPHVGGSVDAEAIRSVSRMNIDRCFIGACAVSSESGVSAMDIADAAFKRALVEYSREVIVLATNEKFEARAAHRVTPVESISGIVVEADLSAEKLADLARAGLAIVAARGEQADLVSKY